MNNYTTWLALVFLIMCQHTIVYSAPAGMMAFFKLEECPEGWIVHSNSQGRLIHSVTNSTHVNLTLGEPLADLTVPTHSHNVTSSTGIAGRGISTNFNSATFASTGSAPYTLDFADTLPNYPFIHMILCQLVADTTDAVPDGVVTYFDKDTCPPNWTPYSEAVGRIIIPGSSENGIVYSAAAPLESQEDRLHTHAYSGKFTTATLTFWSHFFNNWWPASPGTYGYGGDTFGSSSGMPYLQLLTCRSGEQGTGTGGLPVGAHVFYSSGFCGNLSQGLWKDADANVTGHWIISLPVNGTVGFPFGGDPWIVTSTQGRYGMGHAHRFNGTLTLPTFSMLVLAGTTDHFVPAGSYYVTGTSEKGDLGIPYLSMPMCALHNKSDPSPSPDASSSDKRVNIGTMWIGIITGGAACMLMLAVLIGVLAVRRRRQQWNHLEKPEEHNTISISMADIQTDSAIAIHNIQINERLGGGNFGEVFKGVWNGTTPVALKKLKSREQIQEFAQEAKVLLSLNHPNIVRCHGIHTSASGEYYIVMEFLSSGSLDSVLRTEPNLVIGDLLIMAKHAAAGMLYLEQQHVVHRDLALRNLLVASDTSSYTVKVSDFGLSRKIQENGFYMKLDTEGIPIRWTAPEVFVKGLYSMKSDVWSFGITLWELFSFGQTPYSGMTNLEVMQQVVAGYRLACPRDCPDEIFTLMRQCWQERPEARPGFKEIYDVIESASRNHSHQSWNWTDNALPLVVSNYNTEDAQVVQQEHYNS